MTPFSQFPQRVIGHARRQMAHDRTEVTTADFAGTTTIPRTGQRHDAKQVAVRATQQRDNQVGGEPGIAVSSRVRHGAEELAGDPRIAAVEQVQIAHAEPLQMRQATTPFW